MITQALPQPVRFGINYYVLRWRDYLSRHADQSASAVQPPDYYLAYGDKYCRRFRLELRQRFTLRGQTWVDKTCTLLQQMLEQTCADDPQAFARLEEDADAFRRLAYSQHAAAYIQGGIADLPLRDLVLILYLVDLRDLITPVGLFQAAQVLVYLARVHGRDALNTLTTIILSGRTTSTQHGLISGSLFFP